MAMAMIHALKQEVSGHDPGAQAGSLRLAGEVRDACSSKLSTVAMRAFYVPAASEASDALRVCSAASSDSSRCSWEFKLSMSSSPSASVRSASTCVLPTVSLFAAAHVSTSPLAAAFLVLPSSFSNDLGGLHARRARCPPARSLACSTLMCQSPNSSGRCHG